MIQIRNKFPYAGADLLHLLDPCVDREVEQAERALPVLRAPVLVCQAGGRLQLVGNVLDELVRAGKSLNFEVRHLIHIFAGIWVERLN